MASRPKTLTAAIVPIMVASSLVYFEKQAVDWALSFYALMGAVFIQIATNLFNDAIDFKKGADTETRLGPKRLTHAGEFTYKKMLFAGVVCCLLALAFGLPLVMHAGWPLVAVGLVSIFMAFSYTGGPFPLAYLGLGDLFVILFFGLIAVGGVYFIQVGSLSTSALVAGLQMGFLSTVLIAINNLRDVDQDKLVNKKTLAVRMGKTFTRIEVSLLYSMTFILGFYWFTVGAKLASLLPLVVLPLVVSLVVKIFKTEPSVEYNRFLANSSIILVIYTLMLSLGFVLS